MSQKSLDYGLNNSLYFSSHPPLSFVAVRSLGLALLQCEFSLQKKACFRLGCQRASPTRGGQDLDTDGA